jgi:hypothetical protein
MSIKREGDMIRYNGDIETLIYDFMLNTHLAKTIMEEMGYIVSIVNSGSHVTVHYFVKCFESEEVVLLPISMVDLIVKENV